MESIKGQDYIMNYRKSIINFMRYKYFINRFYKMERL